MHNGSILTALRHSANLRCHTVPDFFSLAYVPQIWQEHYTYSQECACSEHEAIVAIIKLAASPRKRPLLEIGLHQVCKCSKCSRGRKFLRILWVGRPAQISLLLCAFYFSVNTYFCSHASLSRPLKADSSLFSVQLGRWFSHRYSLYWLSGFHTLLACQLVWSGDPCSVPLFASNALIMLA